MIWGADMPADDWRKISAHEVAKRAIQRLEAKGKGILLLHDIHARTVDALPIILAELKERGFRIVHVVPATADRPATTTVASDWRLQFAIEGRAADCALPKTAMIGAPASTVLRPAGPVRGRPSPGQAEIARRARHDAACGIGRRAHHHRHGRHDPAGARRTITRSDKARRCSCLHDWLCDWLCDGRNGQLTRTVTSSASSPPP